MRLYIVLMMALTAGCGSPEKREVHTPIQFGEMKAFLGLNYMFIYNDFSYEFWVKTRQPIELENETTANDSSGRQGQRFALFPDQGHFNIAGSGISIGTNGVALYENYNKQLSCRIVRPMPLDTGWHHVAVVYREDVPTLFVDGKKIETTSYSTYKVGTYFSIAREKYDNKHFKGEIDEFRVWNYPLSDEEINSRMHYELGGTESGLALYFDFNDMDGIHLILDKSGNQNHAHPVIQETVFGVEINR